MFSQSADQPAADQTPAPVGMRELPPQPAKPVMPAYTMPVPGPAPVPTPAAVHAGPGPDDSVIARDDHFEGTFTSRGTVVVIGSVKGRVEAVRVRIEDGARVDADVIVDEAIVAGEFTGNLTCRERLEAHASGRINGRVETYRLMLHEGASVEGEMHMLAEAPRDASTTIRGSAPLRGEVRTEPRTETASPTGSPAVPPVTAPTATKPAPAVTPSSAAKAAPPAPRSGAAATPTTPSGSPSASPGGSTASSSAVTSVAAPGLEAASTPRRSPLAEALRLETLLVAPRTMSAAPRTGSPVGATSAVGTASRTRNGTTTGF
jgi:cytoskeletal protein CcmA (bactofilin family)